jgi:hypothetical protein
MPWAAATAQELPPVQAVEPEAESTPLWTARDITTSIQFNPDLLRDLGLEIRNPSASVITGDPSTFRFSAPSSWSLLFTAPHADFEDFLGGRVRHTGRLELVGEKTTISFKDFELRRGPEPRTFEIYDAQGRLLFIADNMHLKLDPVGETFSAFNMDLAIAEPLAERMGEPRLANVAIALLRLDARVDVPPGVDLSPVEGACTNPVWDQVTDVQLIDIDRVQQMRRDSATGDVVIAPDARLKNVGTSDVPWYAAFSGNHPPYDNDQHPLLVWGLYRVSSDGVLEMIGKSAVKHAFLTINAVCPCGSGNILWLVCEDEYSSGNNDSSTWLAPRDEITAHLGIWNKCNSWFDPDCDGLRENPGQDPATSYDFRMVVNDSELGVAGAEYFLEAWYVVRDDADIFNTMGLRQVTPSFGGSTWTFALSGPFKNGPVVDLWVSPNSPPAGSRNELLDTGVGKLKLAVKTTSLGGGQWRYDYALMNHDFDRQIRSLAIPVAPGMSVTGVGFSDADADSANDWQAQVGSTQVVWSTSNADPGANALDWGTLYHFHFTADAAPQTSTATLLPLEPGLAPQLQITTVAPAAPAPAEIFSDGFESGNTSAWSSAVP